MDKKKTIIAVVLVLVLLPVIAAVNTFINYKSNYDWSCRQLQNGMFEGNANSFDPRAESADTTGENGVRTVTEICYGETFPNSYLDISCAGEDGGSRPTLIYLHGGGHVYGDKSSGDPLCPYSEHTRDLLDELCLSGFNVVSLNYCFAPEYRYPCQILQLDGALKYLREHARELGLDMENVVLAGSGTGAVYVSQWAAILTSTRYRARFNEEAVLSGYGVIETPALGQSQLKALVLEDPPMDVGEMDSNTLIFYKGWFGDGKPEKTEGAKLTLVADFVSDGYIPCFISAGNTDCYPEDAETLHRALDRAGVENVYFHVEAEEEKLGQGFLSGFETSETALRALDECVEFLKAKTAQ